MGCQGSSEDRSISMGVPIKVDDWTSTHVIEWIRGSQIFGTLTINQKRKLTSAIETCGINGNGLKTLTEYDIKNELELDLGTRRTLLIARDTLVTDKPLEFYTKRLSTPIIKNDINNNTNNNNNNNNNNSNNNNIVNPPNVYRNNNIINTHVNIIRNKSIKKILTNDEISVTQYSKHNNSYKIENTLVLNDYNSDLPKINEDNITNIENENSTEISYDGDLVYNKYSKIKPIIDNNDFLNPNNTVNPRDLFDHEDTTGMMISVCDDEKEINIIGKLLWQHLCKNYVKYMKNDINILYCLNGKDLIEYIKTNMLEYLDNDNINISAFNICQKLLDYGYIKNIRTDMNNYFFDTQKSVYQFDNNKYRMFIKQEEPDRRSWTMGTDILVNSRTYGDWIPGTVIDVHHDILTIKYVIHDIGMRVDGYIKQNSNKSIPNDIVNLIYSFHGPLIMRKQLDRYADNSVKSTKEYINHRKSWKKLSRIEVYSAGNQGWCDGKIDEVLPATETQKLDIFRVFYTNSEGRDFSKYLDRWSPFIRRNNSKYSVGTEVMVFSTRYRQWISGRVIGITNKSVVVKFGDQEKPFLITSKRVKLIE